MEYVNSKLRARYLEIAKQYEVRGLKVENEKDLKKVFTCPLSLHRSRNCVAVCFPLDIISDFTPEWASPERYLHWSRWDRFEAEATDQLAEKARRVVGAYPLRRVSRAPERKGKSTTKLITPWLEKQNDADLPEIEAAW